jgi:hypothetical protein
MSKRSFVTQTKADGQKKFAWFLHILPTAAEILAKEKNSYFSLLPPDLTTTLKRFET